jgi:pimeloyl-ACP methyl ester carboxylesterase
MHPSEQTFWLWQREPSQSNRIFYIEKGSGSNHVILIHGFAAHSYTWRYAIEPLVKAGYHVWAFDLLGFGSSDKPIGAPYGLDLFINQISAFITAKGIPSAHFVGNSLGGGISIGFALHSPDLVKSLTLINAMGHPMQLPFFLQMARSSPTMAKPLISRSLIKTAISDIIYKKEALSEQQIDAYWMPLEQPGGKEAFLELLQMFDNKLLEKMQESFHRIKVPTLIIWGDHDRLIPVAHATLFHQEIPNAELMIIKDCGHIPQEEEPDLVNSRLLDFLHKSV